MTTLELSPEVRGMRETNPSPASPHARPLRYRLHEDRPRGGTMLDFAEAWLERDLTALWDAQRDPAWATKAWEAELGTLRAADLLDAVLDAADAAADAVLAQSGTVRTRQTYADCLRDLAVAILGVQR